MFDTYVIEIDSDAAGLVVRDRGGFRFFSADASFAGLDGRLFCDPRAAEQAVIRYRDSGDHKGPLIGPRK
ncbi:MAG TPA: hypothetical protein VK442_11420 [Xanthobacteraceae bacterium]|nr:hypothetical protein [Xanthobacteraceae bacterium]